MTAFALDNSGDARLALQEIFRDYGLAGIDDEALVTRLLPDLLPDSPREASLLRSAAGANVGHLLTDRISAHMPAEAAVRDVTAMLTTRLAFDAAACLWVVTEYALAMGHPVANPVTPVAVPAVPAPVAPVRPADAEPTHMDRNAGAPGYRPGRAGPVLPPSGDDLSGSFRVPTRKNRVPLIIGIVVVLALAGTIGIALALRSDHKCTGSACVATAAKTPTTNHPTTSQPTTTPPSSPGAPSVGPSVGGSATLADVMPADLLVDQDCDSKGTPFIDHASGYFICTESDGTDMVGMTVWGYEFATKSAYQAGIAQFNSEVKFSTARAGITCPPATGVSGYESWYRDGNDNESLGHLECYYSGDHKNKNYAWTDDAERTIIVAEATSSQTFSQLDTWWKSNNSNEAN